MAAASTLACDTTAVPWRPGLLLGDRLAVGSPVREPPPLILKGVCQQELLPTRRPAPPGQVERGQSARSQRSIVLLTTSVASRWTKWPAFGTVTSVRSFSSHFQVSLSAPGSRYWSSSPWTRSTGHFTGGKSLSSL